MSLKLSEIFYSLQGEGPATGHPAVFIRTTGCNLNCGQEKGAEWKCDTWDVMRSTTLEVEPEHLYDLLEAKVPNIAENELIRMVFTGGEPLLQSKDLVKALSGIKRNFLGGLFRVDIETNGTILDRELLDMIWGNTIISPKLSNSHISKEKRLHASDLKTMMVVAQNAYLKLVVSSFHDVAEIITDYIPLLKDVYADEWNKHIYLMPAMEDVPSMEIKQLVWKTCMDLQIPMTMRAHIDTFGKKTGV